ncbi:lysophospholipid acyltransferase family protein [Bacteroidales bacterium OttesenSCG-928-M11]|nr:lysophospholipid acyltransferase family protein [Bacteroidales bacterium OttesenSCG-928-M11]
MKIGSTIAYYVLKTIWLSYSIIPLPVMYVISDILFYPFYYLIRYRRKIVRKNLRIAFPEKEEKELIRLERRFYHFFLDVLFEMNKYASISERGIRKRMSFKNTEEVNSILESGDSISLYVGHYCNWEWVSSMPLHLYKGSLPAQIYHKLRNKAVDKLLYQNRKRFGAINVEMKETLRWVNEQLSNNRVTITGYIADQSPRKKHAHYFIDFFNRSTPVLTGTEKITKRYKLKAYYLDIKRIKRGYYEASFIKLHDNPSSLPDFELTNIYYQHLENMIRRQPELYLWSHNRFKHSKRKEETNESNI